MIVEKNRGLNPRGNVDPRIDERDESVKPFIDVASLAAGAMDDRRTVRAKAEPTRQMVEVSPDRSFIHGSPEVSLHQQTLAEHLRRDRGERKAIHTAGAVTSSTSTILPLLVEDCRRRLASWYAGS